MLAILTMTGLGAAEPPPKGTEFGDAVLYIVTRPKDAKTSGRIVTRRNFMRPVHG